MAQTECRVDQQSVGFNTGQCSERSKTAPSEVITGGGKTLVGPTLGQMVINIKLGSTPPPSLKSAQCRQPFKNIPVKSGTNPLSCP